MKKNSLIKYGNDIYRILEIQDTNYFAIDCIKRTMPKWFEKSRFDSFEECTENELQNITGIIPPDISSTAFSQCDKKIMHERFTIISSILPSITNLEERCRIINYISIEKNITQKTVRYYLCLYLTYQNISILAPKIKTTSNINSLTDDEKNISWALNKYFYSPKKYSLRIAYRFMLNERYCDETGTLFQKYPSFYQFRYFYRKHKNLQKYFISREGIKEYQRNHRPLLGDGVQEYAKTIGTGMLDSTICDIYLVSNTGELIGRPYLTVCIDTYSSLCCGYSLSWEGGIYSLKKLMLNIISDKVLLCEKFGIHIQKSDWSCDQLPGIFITDMGSEYKSKNFEQITELGVTIINLPSYRPELKGPVENFFKIIQEYFKPYLKGKGVVEPDFNERGAHDYKKDACLTMNDFEKIILYCIIYYNTKRIMEKFPYTEEMIINKIQPYANYIWEWGKTQSGVNLITVDSKQMVLTLLPRTTGKFTRYGLKVNKIRYKHENYVEKFLSGKEVIVAYNPDDVSFVWLIENNSYIRFELVESRFNEKDLSKVQELKNSKRDIIKTATLCNIQAQLDFANHIKTVTNLVEKKEKLITNSIKENRKREVNKTHIDYVKENRI